MIKIIDTRGFVHIFKWKINIIDLMVILFILCLMPMGYHAWRILHKLPLPLPQINWEQRYNEERADCEKRHNQDLQNWQQKYDEEVVRTKEETLQKEEEIKEAIKAKDILQNKIDNFLKEHKRTKKHF